MPSSRDERQCSHVWRACAHDSARPRRTDVPAPWARLPGQCRRVRAAVDSVEPLPDPSGAAAVCVRRPDLLLHLRLAAYRFVVALPDERDSSAVRRPDSLPVVEPGALPVRDAHDPAHRRLAVGGHRDDLGKRPRAACRRRRRLPHLGALHGHARRRTRHRLHGAEPHPTRRSAGALGEHRDRHRPHTRDAGPAYQLWEIARTTHVSHDTARYVAAQTRRDLGRRRTRPACKARPFSRVPTAHALDAALEALRGRVATGTPPRSQPGLRYGADGLPKRDRRGNARGGVRLPEQAVRSQRAAGRTPAPQIARWPATRSRSATGHCASSTRHTRRTVQRAAAKAVSSGVLLPNDASSSIRAARKADVPPRRIQVRDRRGALPHCARSSSQPTAMILYRPRCSSFTPP